jgi:hypothetical protein
MEMEVFFSTGKFIGWRFLCRLFFSVSSCLIVVVVASYLHPSSLCMHSFVLEKRISRIMGIWAFGIAWAGWDGMGMEGCLSGDLWGSFFFLDEGVCLA